MKTCWAKLKRIENQAWADYRSGKIEYSAMRQKVHTAELELYMPELQKLRNQKNWKAFMELALEAFGILPEVFNQYYAEVPDNLKYSFCIDAYNSFSVPALEPAVIQAPQYGRPALPEEIATAPYIEVYLAAELPIKKVSSWLRWQTTQEPAEELFQECMDRCRGHVYKAKIQPAHIIAYSNHDILQYKSVYDIEDLNIPKPRKKRERGDIGLWM